MVQLNITSNVSFKLQDIPEFLETETGKAVPLENISLHSLRGYLRTYHDEFLKHVRAKKEKCGMIIRGRLPKTASPINEG